MHIDDTAILFGTANYVALALYLSFIFIIGAWFITRQKSDSDYFKAGGRIPGWAAGLSVFATTLSSVTYVSTPEQVYNTDWSYYWSQVITTMMQGVIYLFYLPFFRLANLTSAYEYLEKRFDVKIRAFASAYFIIFHIGRIAIVTYITALSLMPYMGIPREVVVTLIGVVCIIYTFIGGFEGVIWADVVQAIILSLSIIAIGAVVITGVDGGVPEIVRVIGAEDKFFPTNLWRWDWVYPTYPTIIIGFFFQSLQQYTSSQDVIQRYISCKTTADAERSLLTVAILTVCVPVWFYAVGSCLYVFYSQRGTFSENFNTAGILPFFIVTELPPFLAGLVIAGIFAASQSSISSSLNSISACVTTDFYRRFGQPKSTKQCLICARIVICIAGAIGAGASFYLVIVEQNKIWDQFNALIALLGGPLTGVFALGIFIPRANALGCLIAIIASLATVFPLSFLTNINAFYDGAIGTIVILIVGFAVSLLGKAPSKTIQRDLTFWGFREKQRKAKQSGVMEASLTPETIGRTADYSSDGIEVSKSFEVSLK